MFWLGRYAERVENVGRLLRAIGQRLAESDPAHLATLKVLTRFRTKRACAKQERRQFGSAGRNKITDHLGPQWVIAATGDPKVVNGVPANVARLFFCATQLRERMSLDHWRTVQRLAHVHEPVPQVWKPRSRFSTG